MGWIPNIDEFERRRIGLSLRALCFGFAVLLRDYKGLENEAMFSCANSFLQAGIFFVFGFSSPFGAFEVNVFFVLLLALLLILNITAFVNWVIALRSDRRASALRRRIGLGFSRRLERRAQRYFRRFTNVLFLSILVTCLSVCLVWNETEEARKLTSVASFDRFLETVSYERDVDSDGFLRGASQSSESSARMKPSDTREATYVQNNSGRVVYIPNVNSDFRSNNPTSRGDNVATRVPDPSFVAPQVCDDLSLHETEENSFDSSFLGNVVPVNTIRVQQPINASQVDENYFSSRILSRDDSLIRQFSEDSAKKSNNAIALTGAEIPANSDSSNVLLIDENVERSGKGVRGEIDQNSLLLRIDEEMNQICSSVRPSVLLLETTKNSSVETGSSCLTVYDGRTVVITNSHVVNGTNNTNSINIYFPNRQKTHPINVFHCSEFDVAVLEVDPKSVPNDGSVKYCKFGDSDSLFVGNGVFAVGSPFGLENSTTFGRVSSLRRCKREASEVVNLRGGNTVNTLEVLPEYIQFDASINPGNSGGPLCNLRGEVIGMVSSIATRDSNKTSTGVSFAIPSNILLRVVKSLLDNNGWRTPKLGVELNQASRNDLIGTKLDGVFGAKVISVKEQSPARAAGLKAGDLIIAYNGQRVQDDSHLKRLIVLTDSDEKVRLSILRNGLFMELEASTILK